jgi:nicotinamidase-related amidase
MLPSSKTWSSSYLVPHLQLSLISSNNLPLPPSHKSIMTKPALLLLDLQSGILEQCNSNTLSYIDQIFNTTTAARSTGMPVIYVRTCFRPGHPELLSHNLSTARIASGGGYLENDLSVDFPQAIAPQQNDIVVTKRRVSAFVGSDLEVVLRGLGVDALIICGVSTTGAVLSTVRQAADMDFRLTVLSDLCMDNKPEAHRVLLEQVFPRQGRVVKAAEWVAEVRGES